MTKPRILVRGYTNSGKSTVARMIAEAIGGTAASTGKVIARYAAQRMDAPGIAEELYRQRKKSKLIRVILYSFGEIWKRTEGIDVIVKAALEEANVIDGCRTQEESEAARPHVDLCFWVARGERGETDHIEPFSDDIVIDNTDSKPGWRDRLRKRVDGALKELVHVGKTSHSIRTTENA